MDNDMAFTITGNSIGKKAKNFGWHVGKTIDGSILHIAYPSVVVPETIGPKRMVGAVRHAIHVDVFRTTWY
jgi:hypothetical protein